MNDREMLELAAKAAGYPLAKTLDGYPLFIEGHGLWNPLEDDGDAFRMAVKLRMDLMLYSDTKSAFIEKPDAKDMHQFAEINLDDPYAATRRAIVRAAAEIGRVMK